MRRSQEGIVSVPARLLEITIEEAAQRGQLRTYIPFYLRMPADITWLNALGYTTEPQITADLVIKWHEPQPARVAGFSALNACQRVLEYELRNISEYIETARLRGMNCINITGGMLNSEIFFRPMYTALSKHYCVVAHKGPPVKLDIYL